MKDLFYINYTELNKINNTKSPLGVIVDTRQVSLEELNDFMIKIYEEQENHLIEKIIVKMDLSKEILPLLKKSNKIYYMFYNEDDYREDIVEMPDELKKQIIGIHYCSTGVQILMYRAIGIKNIIITSPLINDSEELKMLTRIGYVLFAIPNYNNSFGKQIDPNWIRPEGIELYDNIHNWILVSGSGMDINTIFESYNRKTWIGNIGDFLVNFNNSYNSYKNMTNLLLPTFDIKRTLCRGECMRCNYCEREFQLSNQITGRQK